MAAPGGTQKSTLWQPLVTGAAPAGHARDLSVGSPADDALQGFMSTAALGRIGAGARRASCPAAAPPLVLEPALSAPAAGAQGLQLLHAKATTCFKCSVAGKGFWPDPTQIHVVPCGPVVPWSTRLQIGRAFGS